MKLRYNLLLLTLIVLAGCKEFNHPDQAKNEVNSKGIKIGRWIEFIDSANNVENEFSPEFKRYRLIEYDAGYPIGDVKEYHQNDSSLYCKYKVVVDAPNTLIKNNVEKAIDTIYYYDRSGFVSKKKITNKKFILVDTIYTEGEQSIETSYYLNLTINSRAKAMLDSIDQKFLDAKELSSLKSLSSFRMFDIDSFILRVDSIKSIDLGTGIKQTHPPHGSDSLITESIQGIRKLITISESNKSNPLYAEGNCSWCGKFIPHLKDAYVPTFGGLVSKVGSDLGQASYGLVYLASVLSQGEFFGFCSVKCAKGK